MPIVCGTDFSTASSGAANVAALLSSRMDVPLHLLHVDWVGAESEGSIRLQKEARRLHRFGAKVRGEILSGIPDEELTRQGEHLGAAMVVVSSLGSRHSSRWRLGGTADRTAQTSTVPVLVVRDPDPLERWLGKGKKPLRVVVGIDLSASSEAPLRWLATLANLGAIEATAAFIFDPNQEARRMGIEPSTGGVDPRVEASLRRELETRLRRLSKNGTVQLALLPAVLGPAAEFLRFAAKEKAELVVVGTRGLQGIDRMWHGSFSSQVLEGADVAVACVPASVQGPDGRKVVPVERVLIATDFSPMGNAAAPLGYGVLASGGEVVFLHVIEPSHIPSPLYAHYSHRKGLTLKEKRQIAALAGQHLRALVPEDARSRGIETMVEVVEGDSADAIIRAAERRAVDMIVMGTHGRGGLARSLLGSVAREVLSLARQPVLLARYAP